MADHGPAKVGISRKAMKAALLESAHREEVAALQSELERVKLQNLQLSRDVQTAKEAETTALQRCTELEKQLKHAAQAKSSSNDMVTHLFKDLYATRLEKTKAEEGFQNLLRQFFDLRTAKTRAENAQEKLTKQVKELKQQLQQQQAKEVAPVVAPTGKGKGKRELSVLRLVSELKRVKATCEKAEGELQRLREEKERVEESQDMIALQTEALLQERQWLMSKMEQKDADARNLQQEVDKMVHELNLISGDRELLLSHYRQFAGLEHFSSEDFSPEMLLHEAPEPHFDTPSTPVLKHMHDDHDTDSLYSADTFSPSSNDLQQRTESE